MNTDLAISARDARGSWILHVVSWVYVLVLVVILTLWAVFASRQPSLLAYSYRYDFLTAYVGARAIVTGDSRLLYDLSEQRVLSDAAIAPYRRSRLLPFIYPGYVALLLAPLGLLSYTHAFLVWDLINFVLAIILARRLCQLGSKAGERIALFFGTSAAVPLLLTLLHAQFGMLPAIGLGEAFFALRARRGVRAGAWLLLGLIKPQLILAPLFCLLCWRCWRPLVTFLAGTCLVAGASFAALGFWIPAYLRLLAEFQRAGEKLSLYPGAMQNWRGAVWVGFGAQKTVITLSLTALSILLILLLSRRRSSWELRLAAIVLLGFLASPYLYLHDLVIAIPAGTFLYGALRPYKSVTASVLRAVLALAPVVFVLAQAGTIGRVQITPWYLMGVVLLTMAVLPAGRVFEKPEQPASMRVAGS